MISALIAEQLTWNLSILIGVLSITSLYFIIMIRHKHRLTISFKQIMLFIIGIGLLFLTTGSPLLAISYLSFSFHMIQMSILFFIVPPLLLLGISSDMYKQAQRSPHLKKISKTDFTPKLALILFATLFFIYHLPFVLSFISKYPYVQNGYLTLLFLLAFPMWWPVVSPIPRQRILKLKRKKHIYDSGMYIMPACLMFIVSAFFEGVNSPFISKLTTHLCLPTNSLSFQLLPPPFQTKYDQMMAGIFMIGLHKFGLLLTNKIREKL